MWFEITYQTQQKDTNKIYGVYQQNRWNRGIDHTRQEREADRKINLESLKTRSIHNISKGNIIKAYDNRDDGSHTHCLLWTWHLDKKDNIVCNFIILLMHLCNLGMRVSCCSLFRGKQNFLKSCVLYRKLVLVYLSKLWYSSH